jgi:hypothetical protein
MCVPSATRALREVRSAIQVEVSAADFTQRDISSPACKKPAPGEPAYHIPHPGISVASIDELSSHIDPHCQDPEPDIALSYAVIEPDRSGTLVMAAAEALGVKPGRQCHDLKNGVSVVTPAGVTVHPEQVLSSCIL